VAEFYELDDDDGSHEDMCSVWKQVPEIDVVERFITMRLTRSRRSSCSQRKVLGEDSQRVATKVQ
jgi:hypothetical protein